MDAEGASRDTQRRQQIWRTVGFLLCAVILSLFVLLSFRGLELTDEGFYLIWLKNPWEYEFFLTTTGFFFHSLSLLFPDNVVAWRLVAGAMLLASTTILGLNMTAYCRQLQPELPKLQLSVVVFAAIGVFWFYSWWVPSPGYNHLNLLGSLLFAAGVLRSALSRDRWSSIVGSATLIAAGAIAIWMARPSTVFPMALVALVFVASHRRRDVLFAFAIGAGLALLFSLLIAIKIGGTLHGLVAHYQLGFANISLLRSSFWASITEQFQYRFSVSDWVFFGSVLLAHCLIVAIAVARDDDKRSAAQLIAALLLAFVGLSAALKLYFDNGGQSTARLLPLSGILALVLIYTLKRGLVARVLAPVALLTVGLISSGLSTLLSLVIAASVLLVLIGWCADVRRQNRLAWIALMLLWFPISFGVGSGNGIDLMAGLAAIFWMIALLPIIALAFPDAQRRIAEWLGVGFLFAIIAVLVSASLKPYRLMHTLWEQNTCISIGASSLPICLDQASINYFAGMRSLAYAAGFKRSTPVIDMTGTAPSTVFFIDGLPIGSPWLLGGYPGSEEFTRRALETVPLEKLRRAWIMTAPNGHRPIPIEILEKLGLQFPADYDRVGDSYTEYEHETHILWRPRDKD